MFSFPTIGLNKTAQRNLKNPNTHFFFSNINQLSALWNSKQPFSLTCQSIVFAFTNGGFQEANRTILFIYTAKASLFRSDEHLEPKYVAKFLSKALFYIITNFIVTVWNSNYIHII